MDQKPAASWPSGRDADREKAIAESVRDEAVRREWDGEIRLMRSQLQSADPVVASGRVLQVLRRFEREVYHEQRSLLATTLLWTEPEQIAAEWIQSTYRDLAQIAADTFRRLAGTPGSSIPDEAGHLAAFAFAGFGAAMKWSEIADTPHDTAQLIEIKRVFTLAEAGGLATKAYAVPHGEAETALPLTALFVRALMLDALCRGNLGQRQIEIADSWLWEWSGEYALTTRAEGAVLTFDRQGARGLRAADPTFNTADHRLLNIDAMGRHIALVVRGFREGQIFPGYGCASEFRVEEHVTTLEHLRRFLDGARRRTGRAPRTSRTGRLEAFVGLGEVLSKAYTSRPAPVVQEAPAEPNSPRAAIDSRFEIPRRYVRLLDESPFGLGVACEDKSMMSVDVGELIAFQDSDGPPPIVCEVVRRSSPEGMDHLPPHLGLRVLSRDSRRLTLQVVGSGQVVEAIYLPGEDRSGYQDMFLVSHSDFERGGVLKVLTQDRAFLLKLNRVRYHGSGWHLAGFEVVEEGASGGGWQGDAR